MKFGFATLFVLALAVFTPAAEARPPELDGPMPAAQQVGEARYQFLGWRLFDATLWSETGSFSWSNQFALSLGYARQFSANALTAQTISEMSQRGAGDAASLQPLAARLRTCFADVAPGDRITGVSLGPNTARFYYNGRLRCDVEWPGFRRAFFGIWLDASGGNRALSAQLRGES